MEEWLYRSTYSWPQHQLKVSGQLHASAALSQGKEPRAAIGWEAGWALEPFWMTRRKEKPCPYRDLNSDTSAVQPIASCPTDWAIPAVIVRTVIWKRKYFMAVTIWIIWKTEYNSLAGWIQSKIRLNIIVLFMSRSPKYLLSWGILPKEADNSSARVPRSRIRGSIHPLANTSSWCSV
jgi:hypothetical protein